MDFLVVNKCQALISQKTEINLRKHLRVKIGRSFQLSHLNMINYSKLKTFYPQKAYISLRNQIKKYKLLMANNLLSKNSNQVKFRNQYKEITYQNYSS